MRRRQTLTASPGEPPDAEGVHYRDRVREFLGCGDQPPASRLHASVDNVMTNYI